MASNGVIMAYLTKIILPNNLRSESLRAEFLELGQNYNNLHSSEDPLYDKNSTILKFKFEVRDAETYLQFMNLQVSKNF